jgi:hypothetical protein
LPTSSRGRGQTRVDRTGQLWGSYARIGVRACPSVSTARRGHQSQVARHEHVRPWVRLGGPARAHNPKVAGSNPAPATNRHAGQARSRRPGLSLSGALVAVGAPIGHLCHAWPHRATELRSAQGRRLPATPSPLGPGCVGRRPTSWQRRRRDASNAVPAARCDGRQCGLPAEGAAPGGRHRHAVGRSPVPQPSRRRCAWPRGAGGRGWIAHRRTEPAAGAFGTAAAVGCRPRQIVRSQHAAAPGRATREAAREVGRRASP